MADAASQQQTAEEAPDEPWGLSALDDDTQASVMAAVALGSASDVAAMATTCTAARTALESGLRSRKRRQLDALTLRLGWSEEMLADAQILHSTGQHIDDAELLLLCALLFDDKVEPACERNAPHLNHLNLGSNRISDRGVKALVAAASRAPRERLEALMLSRNEIGDQGAFELGRAIEARVAFPNLRLVSMGGNALSVCRRGLEPQTSRPQASPHSHVRALPWTGRGRGGTARGVRGCGRERVRRRRAARRAPRRALQAGLVAGSGRPRSRGEIDRETERE